MRKIIIVILTLVFGLCLISKPIYANSGNIVAQGPVIDTEGNRCGTLWWSLDSEGIMTFTGVGPGATYRPRGINGFDAYCPWDAYRSLIREVRFYCTFEGEALYHYKHGPSLNSWFVNCVNLEKYSDIPDGVTDMSATFLNCRNLTECGKLPDSVVSMQYTFAGCESLVYAPKLPENLTDYEYSYYHEEKILLPTYAIGMTFEGCTSLVATPDLSHIPKVENLMGTFANCTALVTIAPIPSYFTTLFNCFLNCPSVRGVFSCDNPNIVLQDRPFGNFAVNNSYILFVKSPNSRILDAMRSQNDMTFRGYQWDEPLIINMVVEGQLVMQRSINMQYGVCVDNQINESFRSHVLQDYYAVINENLGALPVPQYEELDFSGWFAQPEYQNRVYPEDILNPSNMDLLNQSITVYGYWMDLQTPLIEDDIKRNIWRKEEFVGHFHVYENKGGSLREVKLFRVSRDGEKLMFQKAFEEYGVIEFEFDFGFGNREWKLDEGISEWRVYALDYYGNSFSNQFEIWFDYSPPIIDVTGENESPKGNQNEIPVLIQDTKAMIEANDTLSGMWMLEIRGLDPNYGEMYLQFENPFCVSVKDRFQQNWGYCIKAIDVAGNEAVQYMLWHSRILGHFKRVIPRENYD